MHVEVKLLPFTAGRFRLEDPGGDETRARAMGVLVRDFAADLGLWNPCSVYPEHDISVFRLEVHDGDEVIGTFMPYSCKTLSVDGGVRHISAMLAPVLDLPFGSSAWIEAVVPVMFGFLDQDLECEDGSYLSIDEWMFPLSSRGEPVEQEWFTGVAGDPSGRVDSQDKLPAFMEALEQLGVDVTLDDRGVLDRAELND